MVDRPRIILSGFADEAANHKTAIEQFSAFARWVSVLNHPFIDAGNGVKNVMMLTKGRNRRNPAPADEYG